MRNNGLGPAVVTYKKFFVDGEEVHYTGFSGYNEFIEKLGLKDYKVLHTGIYPGKTISADERINIIRFYVPEKEDLETLLPKIYDRVGIEIGYSSMYGEPFVDKIPK